MLNIFSKLLLSFFMIFQVVSIADEGEIERLIVPEVQESAPAEVIEEVIQEDPPTEETMVEQATHEEASNEEAAGDTQTRQAQEETTSETENTQENVQEQAPESAEENVQAQQPSEEEREARHAEEVELREVGAGEEPVE